jgi:chromosome segregation ATPase
MTLNNSDELNDLREEVYQLKSELNKRNNEVVIYLDKIENLEDEIIKLRELLPDSPSKKKGKNVKESKLKLDIEAKDNEIRELKNRMGFLRLEKIDVEKELGKLKDLQSPSNSTVLRVEDLREKAPLNVLVKDLQEKINKQESLIRRLKSSDGGTRDFEEILKHKEELIESLNQKISDLEEKVKSRYNGAQMGVTKKLLEDLQEQLNKMKRKNTELTATLEKYQKKKKGKSKEDDSIVLELKDQINLLNTQLSEKENEISLLKLQPASSGDSHQAVALERVVEELQNKLNKSKTQNQLLEKQLAINKPVPQNNPNLDGINASDQLKMQREMASFLQNQLDDAKRALRTKVEEIGTIKNEAIRIKRRYEDLENQMKIKDRSLTDLRNEIDTLKLQAQLQVTSHSKQDPHIELRIQELKSIIEDLTKQNIQQRLEINQLRKSM